MWINLNRKLMFKFIKLWFYFILSEIDSSENLITMVTGDRWALETKKSPRFLRFPDITGWILLYLVVVLFQERVPAVWGRAQLSVLVQASAESSDQSEHCSTASSSAQSSPVSSVSVPGDGSGVQRFSTTGHRVLHLPHHGPRSEQITVQC